MISHQKGLEADFQDTDASNVPKAVAHNADNDNDNGSADLMSFGARLNSVVPGTELSPEQTETLETLEANFDKHESKLKTDIQWPEVEAKLKESPEKLAVLKKLIDRGGEPTVTAKLENGTFRFDELSKESPTEPRSLNWFEANKYATDLGAGAHLMKHDVYGSFASKGIRLDMNTLSWLDDNHESVQSLEKHPAAVTGFS